VQSDEHLLRVCRYVERNALRANLVKSAEAWRWSSLWRRQRDDASWLADLPMHRPRSWLEFVNGTQTEAEVLALRQCVNRGRPFGTEIWTNATVKELHLESSLSPRGRPKKNRKT
jgi:putative transposase